MAVGAGTKYLLTVDLVIYAGPVMDSNFSSIVWDRPTEHILFNTGPDGGYGSSSFAALAESMRGSDGRILPNLLASRGLSRSMFDKVAICGFSAFHGLAAPLLGADGDQIDAAVMLDACFGSAGAPRKDGYVSFGRRAAAGSRLMVMTASAGQNAPPLPPSTTGYECVLANAQEAAGPALAPFDPPSTIPFPSQGQALKAGGLIVLDYRGEYQHGDHINKFGPQIIQTFLVPYMSGRLTFFGLADVALFLAAAGVGFVGVRAAMGRPLLPAC